jgi:predicted DCC family thiol-disulfide oxidoreductase YuxK
MEKIVFYDGGCGLCQRSIAFLSKLDAKKELFFAPLNGETYKAQFKEESDLSTVVFYSRGKIFVKTDAFIEIGKTLGGWKKIFILLRIVPLFIRNILYDFIASYRRKVSCIILTRDHRFLN